jgi:glucose/arabinose dehydrogenase
MLRMTKRGWGSLTVVAVLAALVPRLHGAPQGRDQPLADPIPEGAIASGLGLIVEEFASLPKSDPLPTPTDQRLVRWARINYIGEVPDGSRRMFVPDINGAMYLIEKGEAHLYLDVGQAFAPGFFSGKGLGQGFAFVAFHPEFKSNGKFYTVHTETGDAITAKTTDLPPQPKTVYHGIVTEWTADVPSAATFHGSHREVIRLGFTGQIHGIQQVEFNPTARRGDQDYGLMYIAAGDGGQGWSNDVPQDLTMPYGKILRIDPQGRNSASGHYGIPGTNPFVGKPGVLGEIYAYGMRDPHRFSWDSGGRHRMFLGHIGEHAVEAIYEVRAGDNFGWSLREGAFVYRRDDRCHLYPLPEDDAKNHYTYPVAAYDHNPPPGLPCNQDSGHAVSGGFVYRGRQARDLRGKYVFGDIVDGRVFYTNEREMRRGQKPAPLYQLDLFDKTGKQVTMKDLAGDKRVDLHFGTDRLGELYLLAKANGKIWKVTGVRRSSPSR